MTKATFSHGAVQVFLSLALSSAVGAADNPPDQSRPKSTPIVRLSADMMAGKGLERMGALPKDVRISGVEPAFLSTWFEGQISSQMFAVADGVIRLSKSPFDEVVVVLNGSITVTPDGAAPQLFKKGDVFVICQGFGGTLQYRDAYREITILETKAFHSVMKDWDLPTNKPTNK
jgi:uncharacterized cupin superfamily protein